MKKTIALFLLMSIFPVGFAAANCDCPDDMQKPQAKYNQSRVVFAGRVKAIERLEDESNVEFQVFNTYKGNLSENVTLNTVNAGSMAAVCGYQFKVGEAYLVYAYGTGSDTEKDIYYTEGCTSVKKLSCAEEDIQKISQYKNVRDRQLDSITLADLRVAKETGCCAGGVDSSQCKGDPSLCTVTIGRGFELK